MTKVQLADMWLQAAKAWQNQTFRDCICKVSPEWCLELQILRNERGEENAASIALTEASLLSGDELESVLPAPLPPAPPPTLTEAEKRAKAEGKEPTWKQREKWETQRGPWPRETTKARGR